MATETSKRETNTLTDRLSRIQKALKAPKEANKNVAYKSRSAEQILEAAKEVLEEGEIIVCRDEIVMVGDRYYVKATALFGFGGAVVESSAFAREEEFSKFMSSAQLTGACSSYARKYALGGLFAIDDSKDDPDKNKPDIPTLDEKKKERDFNYALSSCQTVEEVNDLLGGDLPDYLSDAAHMRIKGLERGTTFPPAKYGFINVEEALEFGKEAKQMIEGSKLEYLEVWIQTNDHKIKALDSMLKAAIYNKDGSPSDRLFKLYETRLKEQA